MQSFLRNWKTTIAGGMPAVVVAANWMAAAFDGNPGTVPNTMLLILAVGAVAHSVVSKDAD